MSGFARQGAGARPAHGDAPGSHSTPLASGPPDGGAEFGALNDLLRRSQSGVEPSDAEHPAIYSANGAPDIAAPHMLRAALSCLQEVDVAGLLLPQGAAGSAPPALLVPMAVYPPSRLPRSPRRAARPASASRIPHFQPPWPNLRSSQGVGSGAATPLSSRSAWTHAANSSPPRTPSPPPRLSPLSRSPVAQQSQARARSASPLRPPKAWHTPSQRPSSYRQAHEQRCRMTPATRVRESPALRDPQPPLQRSFTAPVYAGRSRAAARPPWQSSTRVEPPRVRTYTLNSCAGSHAASPSRSSSPPLGAPSRRYTGADSTAHCYRPRGAPAASSLSVSRSPSPSNGRSASPQPASRTGAYVHSLQSFLESQGPHRGTRAAVAGKKAPPAAPAMPSRTFSTSLTRHGQTIGLDTPCVFAQRGAGGEIPMYRSLPVLGCASRNHVHW